ncbi:amidohydrolase family protein [Bradyrhizobium sp. LHD-71]|uniref:amidohydrolase family protein n=1 Tax=Bradyrhizobium sp. LHD-71 TaxID=3072141 RepID=UPI00281002F7|nr:amidohydrolase family protein [Bradyrhizobium sp. LHD-71]MDQ8730466.1 amidohydrolase family protein [Bradyrhizobium sp. LHD-71]
MAAPSPKEEILEPELPICDPHHHLWDFPNSRYLLPELLADVQSGHNVQSTVFVECTSFYRATGPEELRVIGETEFVNGAAAMAASGRYGKVLACEGIVSRADLTLGETVGPVLDAHIRAGNGRFRGIRHAAGWDASPDVRNSHTNPPQDLYAQPAFRLGLKELAKRNLTFEAWQYHPQLPEVIALARAVPEAKIVLNHVGGPLGIGPYTGRRDEVFQSWSGNIKELASCPNVWVKLGGLGMTLCGFGFSKREVQPGSAELADAWRPYLETCITAFGPSRGMLESNFPVDGASCSYAALWNAFKRVTKGASAEDKELLYRKSARTFYRLDA